MIIEQNAIWTPPPASLKYNFPPLASQPQLEEWDRKIETLAEFRNLEDDWDGAGAKAPTPELMDSALELTMHLRDRGVKAPSRIVPGLEGEIVWEWQGADESYGEAEMSEPGQAQCYFKPAGRFFDCQTQPDSSLTFPLTFAGRK